MPTKGADEYAVVELKNDVMCSGFTEVLIRSDNEPTILALKESTATALKLAGVTIKTEESALYDKQCNGLAESAVKDATDAVRTNLACLFRRFGQEYTGEHPVLSWLVKYSVAMVNRYRRGPDGKTAYELRKGRRFVRALPHLAEKILFMIPGVTRTVARVEPRREDGIFLGVSDRSDELYVGTERGMHKVRTVRRREATERFDFTFLNAVTAILWDGPKSAKEVRVVLPDVSASSAMAEAEAIGRTRRLYINKADIMKYRLTEGCLGCPCLAEGKRAQGHSEGCRARHEAEIAKTEGRRTRLTTAYLRGVDVESVGAPGAVPAPPNQNIPMDRAGTLRKRSAQDAGHVTDDADRGGAQPEPACKRPGGRPRRSERMLWRLRSRTLRQGFNNELVRLAGVQAWRWTCAWDGFWLREADQVKALKRLSDEKPYLLILSPTCLAFSQLQALNTKPERLPELLEQGRHHLEFCVQSGRVTDRARWTRSLRASLDGEVVERAVLEEVVGE